MPLIEVQQPYSPIDESGLLEIVGTIASIMHTKGSLITCTQEISFLLLQNLSLLQFVLVVKWGNHVGFHSCLEKMK